MRNLFITVVCFLSANFIYAQSVNDVPVSEIDSNFLLITVTQKMLSKKVKVELDFGQQVKMLGGMDQLMIRDSEGKNVIFNSMIDALNFFSKNGYKFEQAFVVGEGGTYYYKYLMSKGQ
jgi:hypothetical protein